MKYCTYLQMVRMDHRVTQDSDPDFWLLLQKSVLRELRDSKLLTEMQLSYALDVLRASVERR